MSIRYPILLIAFFIFTGNALAGSGEALAQKNNCTTCHDVDKKKFGPSFREVAAKYNGDKSAQATLEIKVRSGGGGNWGPMPMPAIDKPVSDDDIKSLVSWVLSLK